MPVSQNQPAKKSLSQWIAEQFRLAEERRKKRRRRVRRKQIPRGIKIGPHENIYKARRRLRPIRYRVGAYRRRGQPASVTYKKLSEEIRKLRERFDEEKKARASSRTDTAEKFADKLSPITPDPQRLAAIAAIQSETINRAFARDPISAAVGGVPALTYKDLQQDKRITDAEKAAAEARAETQRLMQMIASAPLVPQVGPPPQPESEDEPVTPPTPSIIRKKPSFFRRVSSKAEVEEDPAKARKNTLRALKKSLLPNPKGTDVISNANLARLFALDPAQPVPQHVIRSYLNTKDDTKADEFKRNAIRIMEKGSDQEKLDLVESIANFRNINLDDYARMIRGKGDIQKPGGLSNIQIENIMGKLSSIIPPDSFRGVFPSDAIGEISPSLSPFSYIMNLDKTGKPGSHWVAVYVDPTRDMSIEYFDSFGDPPSRDWLTRTKKMVDALDLPYMLKMKANAMVNQRANSESCGWFAIKFLRDRYEGKPFYEASGYKDALCRPIIEKMEKKISEMKGGFGYM